MCATARTDLELLLHNRRPRGGLVRLGAVVETTGGRVVHPSDSDGWRWSLLMHHSRLPFVRLSCPRSRPPSVRVVVVCANVQADHPQWGTFAQRLLDGEFKPPRQGGRNDKV